jgi:ABC-type transport system involved in multi-copper enzyme maturation permease subunit
MNIASIGFGYLVLGLFLINFLCVILIRPETNFWLTAVILWTALFFIVVLLNVMNSKTVNIQEVTYSQMTTISDTQELQLKQIREQKAAENLVLFRLLGIQTIFSCGWQFIGFSKTGKKYYRTAALTFMLLSVIYGLTEVLRII